tara:strand:- start:43326 stop:43526 length:201 start_codon:yes stop_codon:yes gene_type:complete
MGLASGHPWPATVSEKSTYALAGSAIEASAQYTLARTVFFMDEKQEPPWMGLRRVLAKLYGAIAGR